MGKRTDLRVVKSERAIKQAFWSLVEEEGFQAVTVKQIVERAEVNRSTFYDHYRDKYDLLDRQAEELLDGLRGIASADAPSEPGAGDPGEWLEPHVARMLAYLDQNADRIALMLGDDGLGAFRPRLESAVRGIWEDMGLANLFGVPQRYALAGLSGMVSGLVGEWLLTGREEPPRDFAHMAAGLLEPLLTSGRRASGSGL